MAVEVVDVRKVVVIAWDTDIVKGKTASVQANGVEVRVVANDGETNIFYPLDWTGTTEILIQGSKEGQDTGTITVTGQEESTGGEGPDDGGEPEAPPETENGGEDMSELHTAQHVYYNNGVEEDIYALVLKDNGGDNLNLQTIPESGAPDIKTGVPRREKEDYDEAGGGHTWHT